MIDFGLIVDGRPVGLQPEVTQTAPVQTKVEVTASSVGSAGSAHLLKEAAQWRWEDLRDYVLTEAERRFGPQRREPAKEASILKSFMNRYGTDAVTIAQAAFEIYDGVWASAPITVTRFCKASDQFFADVILSRVKG